MYITASESESSGKKPQGYLSLLLLVGSDVVQRAIAQMFGVYIRPLPRGIFIWIGGYTFISLAAVGTSIVINCETVTPAPTSPSLLDTSFATISLGLETDRAPWLLNCEITRTNSWPGNWSIFFVTSSGTVFALFTGNLRQWNREKWPGQRLNRNRPDLNGPQQASPSTAAADVSGIDEEKGQASEKGAPGPQGVARAHRRPEKKAVCLARGNGRKHVMILRGSKSALDLESLATATSDSLPETKWIVSGLALLWIILLIGVSGVETHTWFLLGLGVLRMLQNICAASLPRSRKSIAWDPTATGKADDAAVNGMSVDIPLVHDSLELWETSGVRGALRELEKTNPKAGIALMPDYFAALWKIDSGLYRNKREERFWRWMFKNPTLGDRGIGPS
ncbi:hypothetical protein F5B21DRAFT_527628 [Xylaria acuta]|nr:hypothetical protein F5B21DRAFT_527628 [Xylaria acuta]